MSAGLGPYGLDVRTARGYVVLDLRNLLRSARTLAVCYWRLWSAVAAELDRRAQSRGSGAEGGES